MLHEIRKLLSFTGHSFEFFILLLLRSPFDAAMTVVNALFLQNAFNSIAIGDSSQLISVCLKYGLASLCLFLYNGTIWSIYSPFVTRMEGRLRSKLFMKISSFSYEMIEAVPQGEWVTRLNIDVQMPFSRPIHLPHAVCSIVNICVSAAILLFINPEMLGWTMLFVIPHVVAGQFFVAQSMPELNRISLEATAKNTDEMTAFITCADIAALYDAKDYLLKRFEDSSRVLLCANMKIRIRNAVNSAILPLFGMGGYLVLLAVGSIWIIKGGLTFGDLTAVFQYRSGVLVGSMMLINSMISIKSSMAGIKRINNTMSESTEEYNG